MFSPGGDICDEEMISKDQAVDAEEEARKPEANETSPVEDHLHSTNEDDPFVPSPNNDQQNDAPTLSTPIQLDLVFEIHDADRDEPPPINIPRAASARPLSTSLTPIISARDHDGTIQFAYKEGTELEVPSNDHLLPQYIEGGRPFGKHPKIQWGRTIMKNGTVPLTDIDISKCFYCLFLIFHSS